MGDGFAAQGMYEELMNGAQHMNIRELVEAVVDADVENGAGTPVMVMDKETGKLFSILAVETEPGESHEGNRTSGPTVWIKVEEY